MSFTRLFSILFLIVLFSDSYAFTNSDNNKEFLVRVDSMIAHGEAKKAIKELNSKISDTPEDLALLTKRADILLFMEQMVESQSEIENILALDPKFAPALLTKANMKATIGEQDSAHHYIEVALENNPDFNTQEGLYSLRGRLQIEEGRLNAAEKTLFKAARNTEVSLETMKDLAWVLTQNGKKDEAAMVLKETIVIFGQHLESYVNTGYVCNQLGLYDEAMEYLEEALKIEPSNPYALANMAESYLRIGMVEKALKLSSLSLANDNTNEYAFKIKGECLLLNGENEKACAEFTKAIQMGYSVTYPPEEMIGLVLTSCGFED